MSLIEVAQKLLALNPDAVELFKKANGMSRTQTALMTLFPPAYPLPQNKLQPWHEAGEGGCGACLQWAWLLPANASFLARAARAGARAWVP